MRKLLISDITELAFAFSQITESKRVDLRLEHIKNDACWRFHIDYVEVRLLTTYLGATTEWVQPAYANQAIKQQRKFSGPLEHLDINDVAIFKGKSSSQTNGIVHRSPPLAVPEYPDYYSPSTNSPSYPLPLGITADWGCAVASSYFYYTD